MKINNKLFLLTASLALLACEKEIEYKGDEEDPKLVINAVMENDSTASVYLERSVFFLDDQKETRIDSGAVITLTDLSTGNSFTLNKGTFENRYDFNHQVKASNSYKIQAQHPVFGSAESSMVSASSVNLIEVDTSSYTDQFTLKKKAVMKWNDPAGKNFYMIRLYQFDQQQNALYDQWFEAGDASISNGGDGGENGGKSFFNVALMTDELFDGEQKELVIEFGTYQGTPVYQYELLSLNEEAYKYHLSLYKSSMGVDFFAEPVKVFNNISGGYGVFCTFNRSSIRK